LKVKIETVRTEGLGDSTHVLVHDGAAVIVDPQRDIDRFERVLDDHKAELHAVLETHLHNDYVSGGRDLARRHGADLVMPAGAAPAFRHRPAFHNEDIHLGDLALRPLHTPGHTPEHTSYLVIIDDLELALFSGGSLLFGSAGRTDLLGEDRAETLARLQYGSLTRLASLPDEVGLYPTHGAGSFCTTTGAGDVRASTIRDERATNPVLDYRDEDSFVEGQLSGLPSYPAYYRHMGPINLRGLPAPTLTAPVIEEIPEDVTVIDARPRDAYAKGHLPGSLGIEVRDSFGTWVGWITGHNTPIVLVLDEDQDPEEPLRQLARIGYDRIIGIVRPDDRFAESYETVDVPTFAEATRRGDQVLDVRSPEEIAADGQIPDAVVCYVPDLARAIPADLKREDHVWLVCGTGYRATIAAGIIQGQGYKPVVLAEAGATEVLEETSKRP
jgi:glyoxylase-like metal-dependent hydrolase (beta-lactamase superfamily II)/rhodanese-related sulfurtransferase